MEPGLLENLHQKKKKQSFSEIRWHGIAGARVDDDGDSPVALVDIHP
jgi:hypothetical protein